MSQLCGGTYIWEKRNSGTHDSVVRKVIKRKQYSFLVYREFMRNFYN
uniref:Uncharacterized protein n=1 Tax=Arundo donax TaxID=35708 RepID=A0A0A9BJE0_ARUDO